MSAACIIVLFLANRIRSNGLLSIYSITLSSAAISIFLIPFILKITKSLEAASISLIMIFAALVMVLTFTTVGPFSPSPVFVPAFPIGAVLFVSYRFDIVL